MNVFVASSCYAMLTNTAEVPSAAEAECRDSDPRTPPFLFKNIPPSQDDAIVVPEGYIAEVLYRWGDPINGSSPQFRSDASNTAEEQMRQTGMGHDGIEYFEIPGQDPSKRGLLAINHEYTELGNNMMLATGTMESKADALALLLLLLENETAGK